MSSRLDWRVRRIEAVCGGGSAVGRIVRRIQRASNEELAAMLADGRLNAMAERLSDQQLDRLIAELKTLQALEGA
jgi:hypothetical protein